MISGFFQAHFHKTAKNPFLYFLLANIFVQLCRSALFHLLKYKLQRSAIATQSMGKRLVDLGEINHAANI